ncbi:AAA family ATPase [Dactylosporangium sp. NPDC049140]|uniref:AAA family ATPase n=1 Tax=Dactylosporangium sp. NPDC049140 TaxID=3155647 RepID=UPI00340D286E
MPTAPFIGRAAQLAEIEAAWAARRPGIVLITGEGGSGKSRLVAEVLRRLDLDGTAVLRGSARPQGAAPYDWLASVLNGRPAATLPVEESLLNRLAQRSLDAAEPRLAPATTLRAAVDVVRALLSGTATNHSELGIVVVEDLHDLDPASLALVAELAAAAETLPALLLVTSRPPQEAAFAPAAARTLRRLGGSPSVLRVHVAPFTARETAELIEATYGSAPAPEVVRGARRRTGGNPFWLAELLAAYDTAGDLPAAPLPPHVVGLLVEPLSSEPELVGRVARAAALLGDPVESDVLFHVCGGDVEPALRRLLDLGLLLIAPDLAPTGSLRFRHPLLREALAAGVMPRERTRVHSLARGLAVELGDNAALARHAAALGRTTEARTAAARGAAASLATGLPEAALDLVALGLSLPVRTSDDGHGGGSGSVPPDHRSSVGLEQPPLAQSNTHDAQPDTQPIAHSRHPGAQLTAHDEQFTAHDGQLDAQRTAHDGQSGVQSTAHDASRAVHKAQPGGHLNAQDAQFTGHDGQLDVQSVARNVRPGARSNAQDAQSSLSASARGGQSAVLDRDEVWVALAGVGAAAAFVSARFEVAANYAGDWLHEVQQTDDRDGTADAHRQLAAVRWCLGDPGGHRRSLDRAAAVGGSAASLARQRAAEAESALRTEDAASALPLAEAAVGAAERAGVGIASASVTLGTALALTGDFERGVALLRAARQLAGREHDPVTIGRAVHNLVAVSLPRLGEVMGWRLFDEAMGTIGRYGLEFCAGRTTTLGVAHAMHTGDLARAEALVWSRLPIEGDPVERVRFTARAGLLALERGDDSLAVRMLARADAEGRDSGLVRVLRVAVAARGVHPVDPAEALRDCVGRCGPARLAEAARWALHGGVPATVVEEHVPDRPVRLRFLLAVAAGRDADALELLPVALGADTLSDAGVRHRVPAAGGDAGGLGPGGFGAGGTGIIGLISGDSRGRGAAGSGVRRSARRAAVAAVADGVGPDDEVGGGVEAGGAVLGRGDGDGRAEDAAVHTAAAHALVRLGRAGDARRHAERAVALLAHWPGWRLAEAETLLHSLRAGGDLTARELEVLGCLAAGMTNQQVASSLGISIRTVAVHVSNLLRKTGATSRTEAALWAVRHRLAPER